jgi:hypothetical protein
LPRTPIRSPDKAPDLRTDALAGIVGEVGRVVVVTLAALLLAVSVPGSGTGAAVSPLAIMPLPSELLGPGAAALRIDPDSGKVTNATAANDATRPTSAARLAALGRIEGYRLDYNDPASSALVKGRGLLRVTTEVDRYRSGPDAASGLAFGRSDIRMTE